MTNTTTVAPTTTPSPAHLNTGHISVGALLAIVFSTGIFAMFLFLGIYIYKKRKEMDEEAKERATNMQFSLTGAIEENQRGHDNNENWGSYSGKSSSSAASRVKNQEESDDSVHQA